MTVAAVAVSILVLSACGNGTEDASPVTPPPADASLTAEVDDAVSAIGVSDGDLWPMCWADDDALYAANGDGAGFGDEWSDIVVNRVTGSPQDDDLDGEALAIGDDVGTVWSGDDHTRKPTGMLCTSGSIYLAVQDLKEGFNEAPAATIARSDDHGETWQWDDSAPMFDDGEFTTIWFADYGKDSELAPDPEYAYAFGLDGNWRDSYDDAVPDPTELFLARVPTESVQDASSWEFYAGEPGDAEPTWTDEIAEKQPVLEDDRRQHDEYSVLSQGGVTYLPALDRYVYTSWTEWTFEFYEAPEPWGPWELFESTDFGPYEWDEDRFGGYGTTIPSKFLSEDNRSVWVQSNVCPCAPAGMESYWFGLREMRLDTEG